MQRDDFHATRDTAILFGLLALTGCVGFIP
jgi:hypothetical protein